MEHGEVAAFRDGQDVGGNTVPNGDPSRLHGASVKKKYIQ